MRVSISSIVVLFPLILLSISDLISDSTHEEFLQCLTHKSHSTIPISKLLHTPKNPSYKPILESTIQNLRFMSSTTPKPQFIFTPLHESHVQAAVICSRKHVLQIRVRSGGHDYEGMSSTSHSNSNVPFIIIDLVKFSSISVDMEDNSAWVQGGATMGEVYYKIAEKSLNHGFPAGLCPTVGVGGHISGGGYGTLQRKYGLAADNIIDACLVNVNGTILNRSSMGEDLFWAIRGGGGSSFGVILSWKIRLVYVPSIVTVFTIDRTLEEGATKLVEKWQYIANELDENIFIRITLNSVNASENGEKTIRARFISLFLGGAYELVSMMDDRFPELGLKKNDCFEMSWIESVLYFAGFPSGEPHSSLLNRTQYSKDFFKTTSDYVKKPIPEMGFKGVWERFLQVENPRMILNPYGGKMGEISEYEIPFPHRAGNLYLIQYSVRWHEEGTLIAEKNIDWIRSLLRYMTPYVSKFPRAAYFNYRDLDMGVNSNANTSYLEALVWGRRYFKNNFKRLAYVKKKVDPCNFFWDEQTIPPLLVEGKETRDN